MNTQIRQDYTHLELIDTIKNLAHNIVARRIEQEKSYDWANIARANQVMPQTNWNKWLILAGRGFGKTRTGSETIRQLVKDGYRHICLLGESIMEVRRVMVEGESGLCRIHPEGEMPRFYPSRNLIVWPNGAKAYLFSAENPEALRGPQFDAAWVDEFAKLPNLQACWEQLMMTLRLGNPKVIITTTPKPVPLLKKLLKDEGVFVTRGSTLDNQANLAPVFLQNILDEYSDTSFGRQEIYADIVDNDSANFWADDSIKYHVPDEDFEEIVISVDPAVTANQNSDETGIVVAGRIRDMYYIIDDLSKKSPVSDWISVVVHAFYRYNANFVAVEINQGGNLIKELIGQLDLDIPVREMRASHSKEVRAQPVAMLYQKQQVFHFKRFPELENQLYNFLNLKNSPDRVDALVWGIQALRNSKDKNISIY